MPKVDSLAEFAGLELGDARREARVRQVICGMQVDPAAPFPAAMRSVAEREALYRLLNNARVTLDALLEPHAAQTLARVANARERPIVAIDKTCFVFGGEAERDGLERLGGNRQGFDAFFALALSWERRPHGVLAARPLDGSGRSTASSWHDFIGQAAASLETSNIQPIFVMDREADAYALLDGLVRGKRDFVVRATKSRVVHDRDLTDESLRDVAARAAVTLKKSVRLSRRGKGGRATRERTKFPPRASREAVLSVRACSVTLPKRAHVKDAELNTLDLNLVQVLEENPPKDVEPVEWLLLTTLPIADATSVEAIVDIYRARWTIEEFFKALKTGCAFEKRQLESKHALTNALGLLVPLAWQLLSLRVLADEEPEAPASTILASEELVVLRRVSKDIKLSATPTATEVVAALAGIGGHFPQNGRPGWLVIWRGMQRVIDLAEGFRLARAEM